MGIARAVEPIVTGSDYIGSLRGRNLKVWFLGERVPEPVDHPVIRPSINAVARTYDLAVEYPELATAWSSLSGRPVNRFLHVTESVEDVVAQNKMQRRLGQLTGTCFQRCVGMDAINSLFSVTHEIDAKCATPYQRRFRDFLVDMQEHNYVIGGAMTDPKGDRSKAPAEQSDPDMFVRIVERRPGGIVLRGAKMHQTGCLNSHWILVMPTMRMRPADRDYAVVAAIPVNHPSLTFIYGRQSCDTRALEGGEIDQGNAKFSGQEATIILDDVFELISVPEPNLCGDDASRKCMRQIMGAFHDYKKQMIVVKLRGARQRKKLKRGTCEGRKPYGHYPGEVEILDRMKELSASGMTATHIASILRAEGCKARNGGEWLQPTISKILNREKT